VTDNRTKNSARIIGSFGMMSAKGVKKRKKNVLTWWIVADVVLKLVQVEW
jgi:hypothetical protein